MTDGRTRHADGRRVPRSGARAYTFDGAFWRSAASALAWTAASWFVLIHVGPGPLRVVAIVTLWTGIASLVLSAVNAALIGHMAAVLWNDRRTLRREWRDRHPGASAPF